MSQKEIKVGSEVVVDGVWMVVTEFDENEKTFFAMDEDGDEIEVRCGSVDHIH